MHRMTVFTTATALALGLGVSVRADDEIKPLHIGDAAPAIDIEHWVKNNPVKSFESGNVYVVEFWATWCGPCRASMPHITKLQEEYKDYKVTFIGISDEPLETVTKFLAKADAKNNNKTWNEIVGYTLTTDPDRSAHASYMDGVGALGIPTAFIVGKDSKIEWAGHPMGIDKPLEAVVKDTWDRKEFAKEFEPKAEKDRKEMARYKATQGASSKHAKALKDAKAKGDWDAAMKAMDALIALNDEVSQPKVQKFQLMLKDMNQPAKAYAYAKTIVDQYSDDPQTLNEIAWFIADDPGVKTRDLDFALSTAQKANELTDEKNGAILDTLARVYFEKGDLTNAVKHQKSAVEHAQGDMAAELKKTLEDYEAKLNKKN